MISHRHRLTSSGVELKDLRERMNRLLAGRDLLLKAKIKLLDRKVKLKQRATDAEITLALAQEISTNIQKDLQTLLSNMVTTAIRAVKPRPYEFEVSFEKRRGKTEADLWLVMNNARMHPLESVGGGNCDISAFGLLCGVLAMKIEQGYRPILILDEPFRNLSPNLHEKASWMLKLLSEKLGIQVIMVSHSDQIINSADRIFKMKKIGKISTVRRVNNV